MGPKNEIHDLGRKFQSNRDKWGARNKIYENKRVIPVPTMLTNNGKPYTEAVFIEPNEMDERLMELDGGKMYNSEGYNTHASIHYQR